MKTQDIQHIFGIINKMNYLSKNVFVFPYISAVSHSLLQWTEVPGCVTWLASGNLINIRKNKKCPCRNANDIWRLMVLPHQAVYCAVSHTIYHKIYMVHTMYLTEPYGMQLYLPGGATAEMYFLAIQIKAIAKPSMCNEYHILWQLTYTIIPCTLFTQS